MPRLKEFLDVIVRSVMSGYLLDKYLKIHLKIYFARIFRSNYKVVFYTKSPRKKSLGVFLEEERYLDECIQILAAREEIPRKYPSEIPAKSARQNFWKLYFILI